MDIGHIKGNVVLSNPMETPLKNIKFYSKKELYKILCGDISRHLTEKDGTSSAPTAIVSVLILLSLAWFIISLVAIIAQGWFTTQFYIPIIPGLLLFIGIVLWCMGRTKAYFNNLFSKMDYSSWKIVSYPGNDSSHIEVFIDIAKMRTEKYYFDISNETLIKLIEEEKAYGNGQY